MKAIIEMCNPLSDIQSCKSVSAGGYLYGHCCTGCHVSICCGNTCGSLHLVWALPLPGLALTTICTYPVLFLSVSTGTFALSREAALPANLSSDRRLPDRRARTDSFSDRPPQTEFFSDRRSQTDGFSDRRKRRPQGDSFSDSAASTPEGTHHMCCHMALLFHCCAICSRSTDQHKVLLLNPILGKSYHLLVIFYLQAFSSPDQSFLLVNM